VLERKPWRPADAIFKNSSRKLLMYGVLTKLNTHRQKENISQINMIGK
jgi:hypothetical protein